MKASAVIDDSHLVWKGEGALEFKPFPNAITFMAGETWALRITRDGIESNPDVPTDEGAKALFEALKPYIEQLGK